MASLELLHENIRVSEDDVRGRNRLVSIVIPTYNRAELVARAVHSVLSQTYPNLEVIIVDDSSTDDTQNRIKTLQDLDHRVRYIRHDRNRGAQAARNTGIQAAKGRYVAFLDSDNEWLPRKLERQIILFSPKNNSPGTVYCGYWKVSVDGDVLNEYMPRYRGLVYKQALGEWLTDTSTLVVRKDILEKIHGFDENISAYQEWDLCIRLAREREFDFVPECLTLYHEHTLPTISKDFLRDANGYLCVIEIYRKEILRECGRRTLSRHYLIAGRLFVLADQFDLARAYFLKSIRYDPLNIKAMIHMGASLFGKEVYRFLRSHRRAKIPIAEA
jgi:glycosyltransferase involved in cell wall biosynthesis